MRPEFAHFPVLGTKNRRSPQCRKKFFSGSRRALGTPSSRPLGAMESARDRFAKHLHGFFKALFREGESAAVARVEFRRRRSGCADSCKRQPRLEIISAKLLTSRFPVISFRPADVNCGCERSEANLQRVPRNGSPPGNSTRWTRATFPPRNVTTASAKPDFPAPGPVSVRAFSFLAQSCAGPYPSSAHRARRRCAAGILPWWCLCDWAVQTPTDEELTPWLRRKLRKSRPRRPLRRRP